MSLHCPAFLGVKVWGGFAACDHGSSHFTEIVLTFFVDQQQFCEVHEVFVSYLYL